VGHATCGPPRSVLARRSAGWSGALGGLTKVGESNAHRHSVEGNALSRSHLAGTAPYFSASLQPSLLAFCERAVPLLLLSVCTRAELQALLAARVSARPARIRALSAVLAAQRARFLAEVGDSVVPTGTFRHLPLSEPSVPRRVPRFGRGPRRPFFHSYFPSLPPPFPYVAACFCDCQGHQLVARIQQLDAELRRQEVVNAEQDLHACCHGA